MVSFLFVRQSMPKHDGQAGGTVSATRRVQIVALFFATASLIFGGFATSPAAAQEAQPGRSTCTTLRRAW